MDNNEVQLDKNMMVEVQAFLRVNVEENSDKVAKITKCNNKFVKSL